MTMNTQFGIIPQCCGILSMIDTKAYLKCRLCPRTCGIDRAKHTGICREGAVLRAAKACLHHWEEPCISGSNGSGTIFFSGCTLGCIFCQNRTIQNGNIGKNIDSDRLCDIFFELQHQGAHNINLVTPDHFAPHIKDAIVNAKKKGFHLPFIYNTSGYCSIETLQSLDGLIDIYMPDYKYYSDELAEQYSHASGYPSIAKAAIAEMVRQIPRCSFNQQGLMQRGIIIRHLILPGHTDESKKILSELHHDYGNSVYLSIMNQYTPCSDLRLPSELQRRVSEAEYEDVIQFAVKIGIRKAFIQEGGTAEESFIPDFDLSGI